jgi:5-formyltetrahydrofolate cyclo-ligase
MLPSDFPPKGTGAPGAVGSFASPPCMAGDVAPDYFDPLATDPQQAVDVSRWRRAERARLDAERRALPVAERAGIDAALVRALDALLARRLPHLTGRVVAGYWPIRGEPDLRPWLMALRARGAVIALPVIERRNAPLGFRRWAVGATLVRGHWNIPEPPPEAAPVDPDVALAPCLGWDAQGYRLGHGGGYFDRTLALRPRPYAVGVGLQAARLPTIFPQPHDIRLDAILTEAGLQFESDA